MRYSLSLNCVKYTIMDILDFVPRLYFFFVCDNQIYLFKIIMPCILIPNGKQKILSYEQQTKMSTNIELHEKQVNKSKLTLFVCV